MDKRSDYCDKYVSDVQCLGIFVSTDSSEKWVNAEDKSLAIVCDVAC